MYNWTWWCFSNQHALLTSTVTYSTSRRVTGIDGNDLLATVSMNGASATIQTDGIFIFGNVTADTYALTASARYPRKPSWPWAMAIIIRCRTWHWAMRINRLSQPLTVWQVAVSHPKPWNIMKGWDKKDYDSVKWCCRDRCGNHSQLSFTQLKWLSKPHFVQLVRKLYGLSVRGL